MAEKNVFPSVVCLLVLPDQLFVQAFTCFFFCFVYALHLCKSAVLHKEIVEVGPK